MGLLIQLDGARAQVGARVAAGGEGQHPARGELTHSRRARVVEIEHGNPGGQQAGHDLALGPGHAVHGAEAAHMGVPDHEHGRRVQRRDRGEVSDVPAARGPHLQHEVAGGVVCSQHSQRQADLVVEAGHRRHGRGLGGQDLAGEVLGGGLAHRARHRYHAQGLAPGAGLLAQLGQVGASQAAQRGHRVWDDHQRQGLRVATGLSHRGAHGLDVADQSGPSTCCRRLGHVAVAVGALTNDRHEERALCRLPGVGDDVGHARDAIVSLERSTSLVTAGGEEHSPRHRSDLTQGTVTHARSRLMPQRPCGQATWPRQPRA